MRRVYIAQHPTEAYFVKGMLEMQGIECCVKGDLLFNARGEIPITTETAPSVWALDETKYDEARAIIKDYEDSLHQPASKGKNWICKSCGEELESQFTNCWKCGESR